MWSLPSIFPAVSERPPAADVPASDICVVGRGPQLYQFQIGQATHEPTGGLQNLVRGTSRDVYRFFLVLDLDLDFLIARDLRFAIISAAFFRVGAI
jgi:hypothetical protein